MKTWMSDNFPLVRLECQYFNICKFYEPSKCGYSSFCEARQYLRSTLENSVGFDCMKFQIDLIIHDGEK